MASLQITPAPTRGECETALQRSGGASLYWTCRYCGTTMRAVA